MARYLRLDNENIFRKTQAVFLYLFVSNRVKHRIHLYSYEILSIKTKGKFTENKKKSILLEKHHPIDKIQFLKDQHLQIKYSFQIKNHVECPTFG